MAAHVLAQIDEVTDAAGFGQYHDQVVPVLAHYGGRYVAVGQAEEEEGHWAAGTSVLIEFPSLERIHEWCDSAEYQPLKALRQRSTHSRLAFLNGM
jgi:uncharacterized protein (DUF1330 family)